MSRYYLLGQDDFEGFGLLICPGDGRSDISHIDDFARSIGNFGLEKVLDRGRGPGVLAENMLGSPINKDSYLI